MWFPAFDAARRFPPGWTEAIMPTTKQLAYLHQEVLPKLAAHWHETTARARLILLGAHFGWKMSPLTGHWLPVQASLSELSAPQCAQLIDWLQDWAHDRHVAILPPLTFKEMDDDEPHPAA